MKAKKKPVVDHTEDFPSPATVDAEADTGGDRPDDHVEGSLRPRSLADYIGQEGVKQNLRIAIDAAKQRSDVLDHTLFCGPPGLGKTSMAHIIAREMGVNIHATTGPVIERPGDLAAILTNLDS